MADLFKKKITKKDKSLKSFKKKLKNIEKDVPKEVTSSTSIKAPISSLKDVIDRSRLFTMIYSGVENKKYFDILYGMGIRDFLISYHYIQEKKIDMSYYKELGIKFFIDSGAFTYQGNEQYHNKPKEYWEKQIVKYLNWARANKDVIFALANLDLENLFDFETTKEWNKKYFEPFMLETGIPVCFIWHPKDGEDGWEYYVKRYPYTGFSWVADSGLDLDFNFGRRMLDVARKHNSVCHGMGMTRTSLLTKLPFYTSDSTTWLVGLQYGEINYWTGKKMTRLKKDKWKGEYLPKLVQLGLNEKKLLNEEPEEMIRANILGFIQAQEFIDQRLKPRMYWLKPIAEKRNINDENIFEIFPSPEWLQEERPSNLKEYAKALNINPELDNDSLAHYISDCTFFCCREKEEYKELFNEYYMEDLETIHEEYINRVVGSDEERIDDLSKFFWDCVAGKDDTLLMMGIRQEAKERDHYVEEEDFEDIDVSENEYMQALSNQGIKALPSSAPEIDELDKEIFDNTGYLTVRDDKGKFIKGQKRVRKPKNVYSEKYPKLVCDVCYAAQTCPNYKEGYVCAFNKMFKRFDTRNEDDIVEAMQSMVNLNMERMQRVAIFEMLDGGLPDSNLTGMIDQNIRLLNNLKSMYEVDKSLVKQTRITNPDGTVHETTQVNSNSGVGIMEMLMKKMMNKKEDKTEVNENDIIDVEVTPIEKDK